MAIEVLIIRLSAIGDVVHALPVAALLKRQLPGARITWLVERAAAPLLENNPAVDEVLIFPGKALLRAFSPFRWQSKVVSDTINLLRTLRSRRFDLVLDVQGLFKSAFLALLSGGRVSVGFKGTREFADRLVGHAVDAGDYFGHDRHVVDLNLSLAGKGLELLGQKLPDSQPVEFPLPSIPEQTDQKVNKWLADAFGQAPNMLPGVGNGQAPNPLSSSELPGLVQPSISIVSRPGPKASASLLGEGANARQDPPPLAVFIPGTTWPSKTWPAKQWSQLAAKLIQTSSYRILIVGGTGDVEANHLIEEELRSSTKGGVLNLTGMTSIPELIAIFSGAELVVGGDTGPLHIAAATGKAKVIGIYGSTPVKRNGPYGKNCQSIALGLSCQPCFAKNCPLGTTACLIDMDADYVFDRLSTSLVSLQSKA